MITTLLVILGLSLCLNVHMIHSSYLRYKLEKDLIEQITNVLKRGAEITKFRAEVKLKLGEDKLALMPSVEDMLKDDAAVSLENYLPAEHLEEAKKLWN